MTRTGWILSGLFATQVLVIGARGLGLGGGGRQGERLGYHGLLFDGVDTGGLTALTFAKGGATIRLQSEDTQWVLADQEGFPAEGAKVDEFLRSLAGLEIAESISSSPNYHATLQVDEDGALARMTLEGQGKATAVLIGKRAFGDSVYLRVEGSDEVFVVRDFGARDLGVEPEAWMMEHPLRRPRENVQGIRISSAGRPSFTISRAGEGWRGATAEVQFDAGSAGVNKLLAETEMLKASGLADDVAGLAPLGTLELEGDRPLRAELFQAVEGSGVLARIEGLPRPVRFPSKAKELMDWAPEDFAAPSEEIDVSGEAHRLMHGHDTPGSHDTHDAH